MCEKDIPDVIPVKRYVPTKKTLEEFVKKYRDNRLIFKEEFPEMYRVLFPNK